MKLIIREKLIDVERVSITLDAWTSENKIAFLGVTVHWIDQEWNLCERVLGIRQLTGPHSGENMSETVLQLLDEFGLKKKVCAVTTDNASNNRTMMMKLETNLKPVNHHFNTKCHVLCLAHVINLIIQAGLKSLRVVDAIPDSVILDDIDMADIGSIDIGDMSAEGDSDKPSLGDDVFRLREIVDAIRGSSQRENKYVALCKQFGMPNTNKVPLDCPTRSSSTYEMIIRSIEKRDVLNIMTLNELKKPVLGDDVWELLKDFAEILQPLQKATELACRSKSPTSNGAIVIIKGIMRHLDTIMTRVSTEVVYKKDMFSARQQLSIYNACDAMKMKLKKYESILCHNLAFGIAALLDPSMKMRLLDNDFQDKVISHARTLLDTYAVGTDFGDGVRSHSGGFVPSLTLDEFYNEALDALLPESEQTPFVPPSHELDVYRYGIPIKGLDPLHWWRNVGSHSYPGLARLAKEFLSVSATSAPSEHFFSAGRAVISYKRSRLTAESIELLMTLKCWWRLEGVDDENDDDDEEPLEA